MKMIKKRINYNFILIMDYYNYLIKLIKFLAFYNEIINN